MNDDEILDRLQHIDPLREGVRLEPAHSARALTLMESIMATDLQTRPGASTPTAGPTAAPPLAERPSRRRWFVAAGLGVTAVAAVAAALVLPGPGSTTTTLAWTPVPRAATDADAEAARQTCVVPAATDGEAGRDAAEGAPVVPAPTSPDMLPPLAALDVRGDGGLAVFTDGTSTVMCLLQVIDGIPVYAGMGVFDTVEPPADTLVVESAMATRLESGDAVSMITGQAGAAARVELEVPGVEPITATVVDGRFAAWWPSDGSDPLGGQVTLRAFAADGTLIDELATLDTKSTDSDASSDPRPEPAAPETKPAP